MSNPLRILKKKHIFPPGGVTKNPLRHDPTLKAFLVVPVVSQVAVFPSLNYLTRNFEHGTWFGSSCKTRESMGHPRTWAETVSGGGVLEYEPAKTDDMTWGENSLQVSGLPKKAAPGRLTGSDIFQWKMVTDVTA